MAAGTVATPELGVIMTHTITGTPVVQGLAYANAVWVLRPVLPAPSHEVIAESARPSELARFTEAATAVSDRLFERASRATGEAAEVLVMTASLATDRGWVKDVSARIDSGSPVIDAVVASTEKFIALFEAAGGLMAERTTDLKDVRDRILAHLMGQEEPGIPFRSDPYILLADDLTPADTAGLNPQICRGLVTELGGPTSHTSIIARQLGIPCIVATRALREVPDGVPILVDGSAGSITMGMDPAEAEELVRMDNVRAEAIRAWQGPGRTKDGHPLALLANVADGKAARTAASAGHAEGIGLMRTELAFLDSPLEPGVHAQSLAYGEVFAAFRGRKVVVRTLDAGSDKPLPYVTVEGEPNPALGVRGLRTTGPHPNVMEHQLDALIVAAQEHPDTDVWVMAPMVSTVPEAQWFTSILRQRAADAGVCVKAGVMIEVPSAVIMIDKIMPHVDFVSIGSNDLTQYTMAADRMSPDLAEYADPWQPAPLALIAQTAAAGRKHSVPVGVCGEAAADPVLACVFAGMGVTSLSMAASVIPGVGSTLAQVTLEQCEAAAAAVANAVDAKDARARARQALGL